MEDNNSFNNNENYMFNDIRKKTDSNIFGSFGKPNIESIDNFFQSSINTHSIPRQRNSSSESEK